MSATAASAAATTAAAMRRSALLGLQRNAIAMSSAHLLSRNFSSKSSKSGNRTKDGRNVVGALGAVTSAGVAAATLGEIQES